MRIKHKFTVYNLIMLITPILLIGVISVCFLIIFIMKFPVEDLYISRVQLLNPRVFSQVLGEFFKSNPKAMFYVAVWFMLCIITLIISTTITTRRMTKSIENPVNDLAKAADSIRGGNLDFEVMGSDYDEIDSLCRNFDEMRKALKLAEVREEKMKRERSMLIANISHDIKTPVTSIKGYVDGIRDGVADTSEKLNRYLDTIYIKADVIESMVTNLSVFSKMELSNQQFHFEKGDLNAFLNTFVEEYRQEIENRGAELVNNISREKAVVKLDYEEISRTFSNIIDNAVKYGGDRPVIEISTFMRDKGVYTTVTDNGIGIDKNEIEKVFESFYRADVSRSIKGSGLGLGIVRQIIERHGGKIWLNSEGIGKGTTVTVYLPLYEQGETK